jgi:ABC-type glycerol-3-phosphate transport system substrate-binding protein
VSQEADVGDSAATGRRTASVVSLAALLVMGCLGDPRDRDRDAGSEPPPAATTGEATPTDGARATEAATRGPGASPGAATASPRPSPVGYSPPPIEGRLSIWTFAQGDDEEPIKAYIAEFERRYPTVDARLVVIPEDNYTAKVNTSLQARDPPDIAIIEDLRWAKAGDVVELTAHLQAWGVPVADFNPGGMGRMALESDPAKGVYGIGDFLGGFPMVFNRGLFDEAGVEHPPTDRSLSFDEYDAICRAIARPAEDPSQALYGCAAHDSGYAMEVADAFGPDGRQIIGNGNSDAMVQAFEVGTALVRDGIAPSGSALDAIGGESDLFAEGKIAITGTDFTEIDKYLANGIDFGIVPFYAVQGPEPVIDTFTAPWGTFVQSRNPQAALEFLRFLATDAQLIRTQESPDPPLRLSIAAEVGYGADDPLKQQYLDVLSHARPQVFVPNGVEAWDPGEVVRKMTVEGMTEARPILDPMVQEAQVELDRVWAQWEELGP